MTKQAKDIYGKAFWPLFDENSKFNLNNKVNVF